MSKSATKPAGGSAPAGEDNPMSKPRTTEPPASASPSEDLAPPIKLDSKEQRKMLLEAQRAGADGDTVLAMAERLRAPTLTRSQLDDVRLEIDVLIETREKAVKTYWVQPGQQFLLHSVLCPERSQVKLTPAEAKALAAAVSETEPPKEQAPPDKRKAGMYRVKDVGMFKHGGKFYRPGETVELDEEHARSVGDVIESV